MFIPGVKLAQNSIPTCTSEVCSRKDLEHHFGEKPQYYSDDKIVYVYDFNPSPAKRGFYKISKVKYDFQAARIETKIKELRNDLVKYEQKEKESSIKIIEIENEISEDTAVLAEKEKTTGSKSVKQTEKIDELTRKIANNSKERDLLSKKLTLIKGKITEIYNDLSIEEDSLFKLGRNFEALKTIPVNFNKEVLRPNQDIQFKIFHVNRFLYNVSLTDSIVTYESEPSPLLNDFFWGDSTGLLGKLMKAFSTKSAFLSESGKENIQEIIENAQIFFNKYGELKTELLMAYSPCTDFSCCKSTEKESFEGLLTALSQINASLYAVDTIYNGLNTKYINLKISLANCKKNRTEFEIIQAAIRRDSIKIDQHTKSIVKETPADEKAIIQAQISRLKGNIEAMETRRDTVKKHLCSESSFGTDSQKLIKIEDSLSPYLVAKALQKQLPSEVDIRKAIVLYTNLVDQNQSFTIDHFNLRRGNRLDLLLNVSTKDTVVKEFGIPSYTSNPISIEIPIIWNPFISFSTGSFIALGSNLQNKVYTWQAIPNNSNTIGTSNGYILTESSYSPPPVGFSALANIEIKARPSFGFGLSTGLGMTIETNPRLAYFGGASLFIGDLRQLAITGGFAAMQVDKLKSNWQAIETNQIKYENNSATDLYYKELKVGAFISISYTPFVANKGKKKTIK